MANLGSLTYLCMQRGMDRLPVVEKYYHGCQITPEMEQVKIILNQWTFLKRNAPTGPINIPKMMRQIEKRYGVESHVHAGLLNFKVNQLFIKLKQELENNFIEAKIDLRKTVPITPQEFVDLQRFFQVKEENLALERIWKLRLAHHFDLAGPPLQTHEAIRSWLNDPVNANQIREIQELNLRGMSLKTLPPEISHFTGLRILILNNNDLSALPESFGNLVALTQLGLENNHLSALPESFGNLVALTKLGLHNNHLSALPESFGNLVALTQLGLENNHLSALPESFGNLVALTTLGLHNNHLSALPKSFGNLVALTQLWLHNNHLSALPKSFGNLVALTTLGLANNHLSALPESFGNLVALTTLGLYNNHLSALPKSFGNLVALTQLRLHNNHLSALPESFGNLVALTQLRLHNNHLSALPESFGNLVALTQLGLENNHLSALPKSFGNLVALTQLWLHNNHLSALPKSFGNLVALTTLGLANNHLSALPESFGNLVALTTLGLYNNHLSALPKSFGNLVALTILLLDGNPLLFISNKEILKKGGLVQVLDHQSKFLSYDFKSFLGKLFQSLMRNSPEDAKYFFERLSETFKKTVIDRFKRESRNLQSRTHALINNGSIPSCSSSVDFSSSSSPQIEDDFNLFDNLALLGRVIREEIDQSFTNLSEEKRNVVYSRISRCAGHGEDLDWGQEHAFDRMDHFVEAYAGIVESKTTLTPKAKKQRLS